MKKFKVILKALKYKWIDGNCRHICCKCEFKNLCETYKYSMKGEEV